MSQGVRIGDIPESQLCECECGCVWVCVLVPGDSAGDSRGCRLGWFPVQLCTASAGPGCVLHGECVRIRVCMCIYVCICVYMCVYVCMCGRVGWFPVQMCTA